MKRTVRQAWTGRLFILPSLLGIGLFFLFPLAGSLSYAFTSGITERKFVPFQNFADLLHNPTFILAVKNTGIFIGMGVPALIALSLLVSAALQNRKYHWVYGPLLIPLVLPVSSYVLGWQALLGESGLWNTLFSPETPIRILEGETARLSLLLIYIVKNLGYLTILLTSAMTSLPREYREVFRLDSSSEFHYAIRVLIPAIAPMLLFSLVIAVMDALKIFRELYALYGDYPPQSVYMLQNFMNNNFYKLNYQRLSTAAFLVVAGLSLLILTLLKLQSRVDAYEE